ncbi:hypothetical protein WMY93_017272 [Mugilogobius chulae]|uniref:Ig-like domain-containing protein n=1 Tax=Mugilogobius chulae TaxID=88201 RepID=A0AAW0NMS4_9GOBI
MTPSLTFFCLAGVLCVAVGQTEKPPPISTQMMPSLHQKAAYMSVNVGDNVTLECLHNTQVFKYYWFKQSLGEIPRLVSAIYRGAYEGVLEDELKNDPRFKLTIDDRKNNLQIMNMTLSDSGTYFCAMSYSMIFQFVQSVTVFVKEAQFKVKASVRQSQLDEAAPGDSVVINCSVQMERCDEHKVHWFKQSGESAAGVLYSDGSGSDQCERNPNSQTNSCVYNLPMHNVSSEQTGTYYCAVAACGQVLFGNGTKLSVGAAPVAVLYVLSGVSVFTTSLLIVVTFLLCLKNRSKRQGSTSLAKTKGFPKLVQYVAAEQVEKHRRQTDSTWSECIYFNVDTGFK